MSRLDAFGAMTAADVMECLAEDPSVLGEWQKEIGQLTAAVAVPKTCGPDGGPLRLVVVQSSQLPDALSLRPVDAEGRAAGHLHLKHELRDAGFEVGDVVEVVLVRRAPAGGDR